MEYLIIDGYNVINAWSDIFDLKRESLEEARRKLQEIISNFQGYKDLNIIIVYDAHYLKGGQERTEKYDNLTIVFTKENESADVYIERFVANLGSQHTIRVVTLDYLEQRIILSKGGARVSPRELRQEIENTLKSESQRERTRPRQPNSIEAHLSPETLEALEKLRRSGTGRG